MDSLAQIVHNALVSLEIHNHHEQQGKEIEMLRAQDTDAPVTQEEVAYKLFELIVEKPQDLPKEKILPLFAKCMLAVRDPQDVLTREEYYHINPHQD